MRTFVTSDTHGLSDQLRRVLELAKFDFEVDQLIHLGDCVDRGPDSKGVVDLLLKIKNLIAIKGNHDDWLLEFIETGVHPAMGAHGAGTTLRSYMVDYVDNDDMDSDRKQMWVNIPESHKEFFRNQKLYHIDDQQRLFIHAGFNRHYKLTENQAFMYYWDRDLIMQAIAYEMSSTKQYAFRMKDNFKRVYIGHTPTINFKKDRLRTADSHKDMEELWTTPIYAANIVDVDTGGVFGNKLSLLDITDDDNHILYQV